MKIYTENVDIIDLNDFMHDYLKENLSIDITTRKEYDFHLEYTSIEATVTLGDEVICKSNDTIDQLINIVSKQLNVYI